MIIRHKFYENSRNYIVSENEALLLDDKCIYCNLIITQEIISNMVYIEFDFKSRFDYLNKKFNCLTEEELIIKKALE